MVAALSLSLAGACVAPPLRAAPPRHALLTRAALREDLARWRRAVLQRHPRWHGQARLDPALEAAFEQAAASITQPMPSREAFAVLSRVNPALRDGHTLLMPWLSGEAPDDALRQRQFPMGVDLAADGTLRLRSGWRRNGGGVELAAGSVLAVVNGRPVPALLRELEQHSHGETATLRRHMLTLMWPQWLHAVLGWQDHFDIVLESPEGRSLAQRIVADGGWQPLRQPPSLPVLRWLEPGTACLHVPTLDVDEDPSGFAAAVRRAFAALRQERAGRLVIDLRGNTGGQSEAGAQILRPLIERPVAQVSRARERLNEDNNGWFGWRGEPGSMREFDLTREGLVQPAPEAERWRGRTAALVDELSYSATLLLATSLQDHRLATLIGRPSGGHANQTGNMMPLRLPASGFTAFIATREFVRPSGEARIGPLVPDIVVPEAAGPGDAVLERARAWLAQADQART